jgi:hypothetical protein
VEDETVEEVDDEFVAEPFLLLVLPVLALLVPPLVLTRDGDESTARSFCRFRLRRRHRSEALAKCQARLGRMWVGG